MEAELKYLYIALIFSMVLAPLLTNNFYLNNSKVYRYVHITSLFIVLTGFIFEVGVLTIIWPIFNLFGIFLYLKNKYKGLFSFETLATLIPFIFSMIASIWLVAGSNDLYLLGYDRNWSFYAALHGNFLGWVFLGCLAFLCTRNLKYKRFYSYGCYISFVFFLMIALGIDGVPYIKPVAVVGLSVLIPFFIGLYLYSTNCKISKYLSLVSLLAVLISMFLAVLNEFWTISPQFFWGVRSMVSIHGIMNAFLVTPLFYLAIKLDLELQK